MLLAAKLTLYFFFGFLIMYAVRKAIESLVGRNTIGLVLATRKLTRSDRVIAELLQIVVYLLFAGLLFFVSSCTSKPKPAEQPTVPSTWNDPVRDSIVIQLDSAHQRSQDTQLQSKKPLKNYENARSRYDSIHVGDLP